ncbi:NCS2 family permease [Solitalea koreensis]|uniref:Putative MFS transporter, AGZA family, xanthine/uracil permease n=1 Tax=Solitalea koreensis TaxID=543615 RepID=A0A521DIT7_9SPHI|nr:NCS2 family permease [Solitalea koreensis]SMO71629.1 putative MFS transporter, AGZA family, xanthine/uracil permease [Solitalea koreensis]
MLESLFKLREHGTTVRTEIIAGITTFMTMAYILAVNPAVLGTTGMDKHALFTATALSAVIGTLAMALLANLPVVVASGMGLNAFFAFTVVQGLGYKWQFAITAVFIEGLLFLVLTFFNIRELIVNSIPQTLKHAIPVGIGLFITLIGLKHSGLIVGNEATLVTLGNIANPHVWVLFIGLIVTSVLVTLDVKGAILIGIIVAAFAGVPLGVTVLPSGAWISLPPSISPIFMKFEWTQIFTADMAIVVFTFLFVNLFDTVGTLIGVASKAGLILPDGSFPKVKQALFSDAIGTTIGAVLGTSTVTAYVESVSGVAAGGRTGLTAMATAGMFLLALFFAPIFLLVPDAATAPALIIVGLFMISSVVNIDFNDFGESIPAFITIVMMPFTYSIAQGIVFGMLSFVFIKVFTGKASQVNIAVYIIAVLFILKFFF